ncbi:MAG: 6-carboxytetrahydropterin synthase [Candidatus Eiseniibacteriota bacterium]
MIHVTRVERLEAAAPAGPGRVRVMAFDLEATIEGEVDPASGMVVNLAEMKRELRERVVAVLGGAVLDGEGGRAACPTPEALAGEVWRRLGGRLAGKRLVRVRLVAKPSPIIDCRGEGDMDVTRVYEFSASHRLHSPNLDEEANRAIFGKCNNPEGHGHNYVMEVTVRGRPGGSGEVFAAAELDRIVEREVIGRWDHKNLNADLAEFRAVNPTAEEIARTAWRRIVVAMPEGDGAVRLHRIKLRETERNHVEYFGD